MSRLSFIVFICLLLNSSFIFANTKIVKSKISSGYDDAEEDTISGEMYRYSSGLDLVKDNGKTFIVGLRFKNVKVPKGMRVLRAFLQFSTHELNTEPTNLTIFGEKEVNAKSFTNQNRNISSRVKTSNFVNWTDIPAWSIRREFQNSSDIKSIVQEIINLEDWEKGKAMVFMISGSGKRVAKSFNASRTLAPKLIIEYSTTTSNYLRETEPLNPLNCKGYVEKKGFDLNNNGKLDVNEVTYSYKNYLEGTPVTLETLKRMIENDEDITSINTCKITDMSYLFKDKLVYQDISNWNTGSVINMQGMFGHAIFDDSISWDINGWDVSHVIDMSYMFSDSLEFNQSIGNWNVSNVINMSNMFAYSNFNQPIGDWNVSNVTDMSYMFIHNSDFNQNLDQWDVSSVVTMDSMFEGTKKFDAYIGDWNVSNVMNMNGMFFDSVFNQPIGNWDVSNVTNMNEMFSYSNFNKPIQNWNISNVIDYHYFAEKSSLEDRYNPFIVQNIEN